MSNSKHSPLMNDLICAGRPGHVPAPALDKTPRPLPGGGKPPPVGIDRGFVPRDDVERAWFRREWDDHERIVREEARSPKEEPSPVRSEAPSVAMSRLLRTGSAAPVPVAPPGPPPPRPLPGGAGRPYGGVVEDRNSALREVLLEARRRR